MISSSVVNMNPSGSGDSSSGNTFLKLMKGVLLETYKVLPSLDQLIPFGIKESCSFVVPFGENLTSLPSGTGPMLQLPIRPCQMLPFGSTLPSLDLNLYLSRPSGVTTEFVSNLSL
ncbi:hypothetical protein WICPIJ_008032 [Wickerhamomyces pijperi]|uniref:Uncharacterized protein n=1 Tax=Wickerhamomyces pijperi TaxID=599730 RepID=A0A9P8Q0I8_WICPI|nr:hypothetical protein WICPIJ_008032 [Wickerhamomyces pijperi]